MRVGWFFFFVVFEDFDLFLGLCLGVGVWVCGGWGVFCVGGGCGGMMSVGWWVGVWMWFVWGWS